MTSGRGLTSVNGSTLSPKPDPEISQDSLLSITLHWQMGFPLPLFSPSPSSARTQTHHDSPVLPNSANLPSTLWPEFSL